MLRKIINTKDASLVLDLPENLQNRRIEIIAFAIDEDISSSKKLPVGTFFGTLSTEDADDLRRHVGKSRNEWTNPFTNE